MAAFASDLTELRVAICGAGAEILQSIVSKSLTITAYMSNLNALAMGNEQLAAKQFTTGLSK
jgi:hypothetical protein